MGLRLLGPPELIVDGEPRNIGGPRQRIVLCALALNANRVTTMDELIDAVWEDAPPPTARGQIHICISRLRKLFGPGGQPRGIRTRPPGYLLDIPDEDLDCAVFARHVDTGRAHAEAGRLADAAQSLRDALGLWRGPALAGVDSQIVRRGAAELEQQRFAVIEERVGLDLDLGRHREISGELAALVEQFPLSEPLYELFMLALYRCGRQAEALKVSRRARAVLVAELGIEPGSRLRTLAAAILRRDPSLDLAPDVDGGHEQADSVLVPRQLPHSVADFTGREAHLQEIKRLLSDPAATAYAVRIVVISGTGGVGKSTLAVRVAHEVEHHYPDGQLYVDLSGVIGELDIGALLARLLGALGISGSAMPEDVAARVELYRSRLAGKRVLIVLDSVPGEELVIPLLPGGDGCAVIVTSRTHLGGLFGAHHVDVDVFDTEKSLELLAGIVGGDRVSAERDAALELVEFVGGLPLALRIAGARLAAKPHWRISTLMHRLADRPGGLDELSHRGVELRSAIALSHRALPGRAQRLFALAASMQVRDFPAWAAAALLDTDLRDAEDVLEALVDARLLDTVRHPGERLRYRFHNLIRVYANERLVSSVPEQDRGAALARVLGGWLAFAERAHRKDYGGDFCVLHSGAARWWPSDDVPMPGNADWWESERESLVAAIRRAATAGMHELCWDLALTSVTLFEVRGYFDDWRDTAELGLAATTVAGDEIGRAAMLYSLGALHMSQRRLHDAQRCFGESLRVFRANGHTHGCALVLRNSAIIDRFHGRYAAMVGKYHESLHQMRAVGDVVGEAHILQSLARYELDEGEIDSARHRLDTALMLCQQVGYRRGEAMVLNRFSELCLKIDEIEFARQALRRMCQIVRDLGDRTGESYALYGLGLVHVREGRLNSARHALRRALVLARAVGERMVEGQALYALSEIGLVAGARAQATAHLIDAIAIFAEMKNHLWHARTLTLLSELQDADSEVATRTLSAVDYGTAVDLPTQWRRGQATLAAAKDADVGNICAD